MITETSETILSVKDLTANVDDTPILKGMNLEIKAGEIHAIMGPNGSGKSTFSKVLAGHPDYEVTGGEVSYLGQNLLELEPEERARSGVFLAFQYPLEIPGVSNLDFLRVAYNSKRKHAGLEELDAFDFDDLVEQKLEIVKMDASFLNRSVNEGFSGGEKKRNEILQMAVLEPKLAILDETDSGLDIDALRIVANGVNQLSTPDNAMLIITHYQRLLEYIVPDYVHVMANGRIIRTGGKELALELEERGYDWVLEAGVLRFLVSRIEYPFSKLMRKDFQTPLRHRNSILFIRSGSYIIRRVLLRS
ncbi:Fe-S cluster assembly ATPase SufC [Leptolyngbya sp. 7M]|nr:Fe-S cluster assembly ATPase SufC [Leptolyngbya sp. 7M]QYO62163.1 Fe-S cluster assembly ATPase SufC [Leptolyngbya sp. 7M]